MKGVLIGAGFFAQFHAEGWNRISGVSLAAVADPDSERARAFAERWNIPAVYASAEEMLRRERPAFADIATRPETHLELTALAAAHGVHVITQKPMAPTPEDCAEMVSVCEQAGVRLIVHENWRFQAWYREVRRIIGAGALGRVFHVGFRLRAGDGRGPAPYGVQPYFREMPRLLIYETLVHYLDTFRYLAGEIESVYSVARRVNPAIRGEDYAVIETHFAGGAHGVIDANRISGPSPASPTFGELFVEGDEGCVRMTPEGDLFVTRYGEPERPHPYDKPSIGYRGDSVRAFQQHAFECLRSGQPAESEGRAYLATVAAVEACYRSVASGNVEAVR